MGGKDPGQQTLMDNENNIETSGNNNARGNDNEDKGKPTSITDIIMVSFFIFLVILAMIRLVQFVFAPFCPREEEEEPNRQEQRPRRNDLARTPLRRLSSIQEKVNVKKWSEISSLSSSVPTSESQTGIPKRKKNVDESGLGTTETPDPDCSVSKGSSFHRCTSRVSTLSSFLEHEGCAICLSGFQPNDTVCQSNNEACCHIFHLSCLAGWLAKHECCPICREDYLAENSLEPV